LSRNKKGGEKKRPPNFQLEHGKGKRSRSALDLFERKGWVKRQRVKAEREVTAGYSNARVLKKRGNPPKGPIRWRDGAIETMSEGNNRVMKKEAKKKQKQL